MMHETEHLLTALIEECSETIKGACKAQRFGLDHVWPEMNETNRRHIEREFAQAVAVFELLGFKIRDEDKAEKVVKLRKFMDLSRQLGTLEPECDCFVPALDGAGQHSPSCAIFAKVALRTIEEKRKTEHCYLIHCHYLTERRCMCLCSPCGEAKKKDR